MLLLLEVNTHTNRGECTEGSGIPQTFPQTIVVSFALSGRFPESHQAASLSLCSHDWLSSPRFITSAAPQLIQIITEQPETVAAPADPSLTSDLRPDSVLSGSTSRYDARIHLSPPVSMLLRIHSYSLWAGPLLIKKPDEREQSVPRLSDRSSFI